MEIKEKVLHEICRDSLAILDECFKDLEANSQIIVKARNIAEITQETILKNIEEKKSGKEPLGFPKS